MQTVPKNAEIPQVLFRNVLTKNACDDFVCAAEESGNNGLIELDEDVEEQILDAILDGLGASIWVDVAVSMQRQVPAVLVCLRSVHRQCLWLLLAAVKGIFRSKNGIFRTPPHGVESRVSPRRPTVLGRRGLWSGGDAGCSATCCTIHAPW